ncbi:MAG: UV DNA damage repair endonuclease UvsE [Firmicutes bacterium HGW-Firmicutes-7]|nr:MAG: UV DNA damage repair endonuclease UvsE [Firmicutes bacterium HGW-Firmicutes-7]
MSIGYACLAVGVINTELKNCIIKNASNDKLLALIDYNLKSLENMIDYNGRNNIKLFRISSSLIPFGSSEVNNLFWRDIFSDQLKKIGDKIRNSEMRVSMHPGQYTVLNSPKIDVVNRAIDDLNYHAQVLDSFGLNPAHKIVLHIGGVYNEKERAIRSFITNFNGLDEKVKQRVVLENDDKSYNITDVLEIGTCLNAPVVFDNLHHEINSNNQRKSDYDWIRECRKTWKKKDGVQKIHYSQQNLLKKPGSHSSTIRINEFLHFYEGLETKDIDIMLEVKDKNLSAIKCINCTTQQGKIKVLELEWRKYKYKILENSPLHYLEIRKLLRNKDQYPAIDFYNLLESALENEMSVGNSINAAQHIWGYFKDVASEKEKKLFLKSIEGYIEGKTSLKAIKNILWRMTVQYNEAYLLDSLYFAI